MQIPEEIGGYRILEQIGRGGMSTVFSALDVNDNAVALKLMHPNLAADADYRRRLSREVAMMQRIDSPYVAQIIDAEFEGADVFIVTELIAGVTLEEEVRNSGVYRGDELLSLGEDLASALESIHDAGVLHRDIKPSNVMITDNCPVLIDFGISQADDDTRLTQQGSLAHTPGYCDPRVVRGAPPDTAADWWAMTAVLAYAACGNPPFGKGNSYVIMNRVLNESPDLSALAPDLQNLFLAGLLPELNGRLPFFDLLDALSNLDVASTSVYREADLLPETALLLDKPNFIGEEADLLDAESVFPNFYVLFSLLAVAISFFAGVVPLVMLLFFWFCALVFTLIGATYNYLARRRARRGRKRFADFSLVLLRSPFTLLATLLRTVIIFVPALLVFYFSLFMFLRIPQWFAIRESNFSLAEDIVDFAPVGAFFLLLLLVWLSPFAVTTRLGARIVLQAITPTRNHYIFWVFLALFVGIISVVVFAYISQIWWFPLSADMGIISWLMPK